MITNHRLKNFVAFNDLTIEFSPGINFCGEIGTYKCEQAFNILLAFLMTFCQSNRGGSAEQADRGRGGALAGSIPEQPQAEFPLPGAEYGCALQPAWHTRRLESSCG
ncbi:ATP-binding protein [Pseudomonas monteilii]|jgi:hypothetical protein|uniref:ATP-binding protein n=1 Tax=Pseudomonas monteilii TaxID=76759 RepID=UPI001E36AC8F|nr:ATP-binding protein [Pseudomonas monteilii]